MDKTTQINYKKIYNDIIQKKFPHKKEACKAILTRKKFSAQDILELNNQIFGKKHDTFRENQKHRSYKKSDIFQILDYQKKHQLNNTELAHHFGLSRNTVGKWKKLFIT